jgi:hypothetical protein
MRTAAEAGEEGEERQRRILFFLSQRIGSFNWAGPRYWAGIESTSTLLIDEPILKWWWQMARNNCTSAAAESRVIQHTNSQYYTLVKKNGSVATISMRAYVTDPDLILWYICCICKDLGSISVPCVLVQAAVLQWRSIFESERGGALDRHCCYKVLNLHSKDLSAKHAKMELPPHKLRYNCKLYCQSLSGSSSGCQPKRTIFSQQVIVYYRQTDRLDDCSSTACIHIYIYIYIHTSQISTLVA